VDTEQLDNFLTLDFLELLPLEEPLAFQREGVQQGVIEKLRSEIRPPGQLKPPASARRTLPSDALFFYSPGRT
jgi:hypothetical protein